MIAISLALPKHHFRLRRWAPCRNDAPNFCELLSANKFDS